MFLRVLFYAYLYYTFVVFEVGWVGWVVGGIEELESTISGSRTKEHWLLCSTLQCDSDC